MRAAKTMDNYVCMEDIYIGMSQCFYKLTDWAELWVRPHSRSSVLFIMKTKLKVEKLASL